MTSFKGTDLAFPDRMAKAFVFIAMASPAEGFEKVRPLYS
jgi:hypothetical protein